MAKTKQQQNRGYYLRHREEILTKRYGENRRRNKARFGSYQESRRAYRNSKKGRAATIARIYRFIDRHPEISEGYLEFLEAMIRRNERTYSLDMERGENGTRLYDLVEAV